MNEELKYEEILLELKEAEKLYIDEMEDVVLCQDLVQVKMRFSSS